MQTFLPFSDYREVGLSLDLRRLRNQIFNESYVIANGGWKNHPAAKMWEGYKKEFCLYNTILAECLFERTKDFSAKAWAILWRNRYNDSLTAKKPWWLGDDRLHSSHRAALLHKEPEWYSQFSWIEKPRLQYWWPE